MIPAGRAHTPPRPAGNASAHDGDEVSFAPQRPWAARSWCAPRPAGSGLCWLVPMLTGLGAWLYPQRKKDRAGRLTPEQEQLLRDLGALNDPAEEIRPRQQSHTHRYPRRSAQPGRRAAEPARCTATQATRAGDKSR